MTTRESTAVLARRFARNYDQYRDMTLRGLADAFDVTPYRMRTALRRAQESLALQGKVITVPVRDDGWVIVVTTELREHEDRLVSRLTPMITEWTRHRQDCATLNDGTAPSWVDDIVRALVTSSDMLIDKWLAELQERQTA